MGNAHGGYNLPGHPGGGDDKKDKKKEKKPLEAAPPSHVGRRKKPKGTIGVSKLPNVTPVTKCRMRLLKLERVKDYLLLEEEYISNQEQHKPAKERNEEEVSRVDDLRGSPLSVGTLEELIDDQHAIVSSSIGPEYYVNILSFVDKDLLEPGCSVLLHNKTSSIVGILSDEVDPLISVMKVEKAPLETYGDIGGLEKQIQEVKEAVEFPLTHPEFFEDIGIAPPKGVILYGPPGTGMPEITDRGSDRSDTFIMDSWPRTHGFGVPMSYEIFLPDCLSLGTLRAIAEWGILRARCVIQARKDRRRFTQFDPLRVVLCCEPAAGKTLLAKAVANETSATFLRVVGSELIQKYLGDGPKLVREMFKLAKEHAPSIVFIDEIDAVGTKRYDATSGGEKEIQRTMLELLNQLDGFEARGDVKVILATNRIESLDPALIRPGRIDRKIQLPNPDTKTKRKIFQIHTSRMTMAEDVDLEEFVMAKDELSGADIKAICTEAGMLALRERRMKITQEDLRQAKEKALYRKKGDIPEGLYL